MKYCRLPSVPARPFSGWVGNMPGSPAGHKVEISVAGMCCACAQAWGLTAQQKVRDYLRVSQPPLGGAQMG